MLAVLPATTFWTLVTTEAIVPTTLESLFSVNPRGEATMAPTKVKVEIKENFILLSDVGFGFAVGGYWK